MRKEKDFIGEVTIPADRLYGIQSVRACENFPMHAQKFSLRWYKAIAETKLAYYLTYKDLKEQIAANQLAVTHPLISDEVLDALCIAATEVSEGKFFDHFIVPMISGGAGTSINMNVNEIISNRAHQLLGLPLGSYDTIDPIEHANIFQSTNDVIPSALRVAVIKISAEVEESVNQLRKTIEDKESTYRSVLRLAYTQMQEAVPSTWGRFFSAYSDAFSRDWWRFSKVNERLKTLNIGGGAIGTSLAVPRFMVMNTINKLRDISKITIARSENLCDATSNLDSIVEAHGIIKSLAVNLEKFAADLRLLASDVHGTHVLSIPNRQIGSTIMPGKVNPVISEYVISVSHIVYSNDALISRLSAQGHLELNAYLPLIGNSILSSLEYLLAAVNTLSSHLVAGLEINTEKSAQLVFLSPSVATALTPYIGYHKATEVALYMRNNGCDVYEAATKITAISKKKLIEIFSPEQLLKGGYSYNDLS